MLNHRCAPKADVPTNLTANRLIRVNIYKGKTNLRNLSKSN